MSCGGCNGSPQDCAECSNGGAAVTTAFLPILPAPSATPAAAVAPATALQFQPPTVCTVPNAQRSPAPGTSVGEDGHLHSKHFTSTRNACKLCTPLGACLVFRGVEGCIPFLHGSQGCSTYIRRYLISHFREPMDIASSNFHEESAIFGGSQNFQQGTLNVMRQYEPKLVGVATTCLAETIGEDMPRLLHELHTNHGDKVTAPVVTVNTPSYKGTHVDGFHAAVKALVEQLGKAGEKTSAINLFPGMVSAADLRHLKEILADFGASYNLLPDYSETMDGETWGKYEKLQAGGTTLSAIAATANAQASIEFGRTLANMETAGASLEKRRKVPRHLLALPMGIGETDKFLARLTELTGTEMPVKYQRERGRLVDSLIDGHKYIFEKRAIVYGEEDLVIGLAAFLCEIGVVPVLCASGGRSKLFAKALREAVPALPAETVIKEGFDFAETAEFAPELKPDFLIGSSKGYQISRSLKVPLIRVGFPIHDRIGGQRVLHLGYRGAQELYDRIVNSLLEAKQDFSTIGYSYL
jgi:nitrogenase molybdenum-iron protein NifN